MSTAALIYDEEAHAYRWQGQRVPGVNQVLRCVGLVPPFPDTEQMRGYAERGRAVHAAIAGFEPWRREHFGYREAWARFRDEEGFKPEACEVKGFNETFGYAYRFDAIGAMETRTTLVDYKTVKKITPPARWVFWELAGYELGLATSKKFGTWSAEWQRGAVTLAEDGDYLWTPRGFAEALVDRRTFCGAVEVCRAKEATYGKCDGRN
jgi:hypothetical protein